MESSVRGQMAELDFPRYVGMTAGAAVRVRRKHPLIRYSNVQSGCSTICILCFPVGIGSPPPPPLPVRIAPANKYFLFRGLPSASFTSGNGVLDSAKQSCGKKVCRGLAIGGT